MNNLLSILEMIRWNRLVELIGFLMLVIAISMLDVSTAFSAASFTPTAPPSLTAKQIGADVSLSWTVPMTNTNGSTPAKVSGYNIYRATTAPIKAQTCCGGPAPLSGYSLPSSVLTYSDVGQAINNNYYAVSAWYCDVGTSNCSEGETSQTVQTSTGTGGSSTPPTTPTGSTATVIGTANFSWAAPVTNTDSSALTNLGGFHLYRGTSCSNQILLATIAPNLTKYSDSGVPVGTYCYSFTAYNMATPVAESAHTANITVTFNPPPSIPGAPGNAVATCVMSVPSGLTATCTVQ